jgi:alpha-glucosidase
MRRSTHFEQFAVPTAAPPPYRPLGQAEVVDCTATSVRLRAGDATIEVTALAPDLFRVGLFGEGRPVDYRSAAVAKTAWADAQAQVDSSGTRITTAECTATIGLQPLRIGFVDSAGRPFATDDPRLGMGFVPLGPDVVDPLGSPARVYKQHRPTTHYFGCGERTGGLEKTGSHQVFWNVDPPMGHTAALNNMYTSVPFLMAIDGGQAWGLFVDSGYRMEFDLANEASDRCGFAVDGGPLIYYVFAGPTPARVLERYTELTGRIWLPPRWALGNHQSRWGYRTADEVVELVREFRARDLPLDAVYLDIDYMDGYRVFTWDKKRFADPAELAKQLRAQGVKLVTIVDPGVKIDERYAVYTTGRDNELFCRTFSGDEYHNVVWPGMCAFPDFTNPRTRAWWSDWHRALLDVGVAGIWCDMNEPTVFVPTPQTLPADVSHHGDSEARLHVQVHNLYGQLMASAAHEAIRQQRPDQRPFVISRAGFAGLQRWALHWTGDNSSWWEHLWMSMPQLQNLGLSGYAWVGVDIGGFSGDATAELLARWTEFGIFQPFCRNHSAWNTRPQEPWAFGERFEALIRGALQLRQRLVPYLYSLFEEASRTGAPILRPLLFAYPEDETTYSADDEFMLGDALLVAPIARPGTEYRHVYLPRGTWVHHWTGETVRGPSHVLVHAPLGQPAVYVKANTPIPMWPVLNFDGERAPDPLTWLIHVANADAGEFTAYEDAGEGYDYQQGEFCRMRAECRVDSKRVEVRLEAPEGQYVAPRSQIEVELRGVGEPQAVTVDDQAARDAAREGSRLLVRLGAGEGHVISVET